MACIVMCHVRLEFGVVGCKRHTFCPYSVHHNVSSHQRPCLHSIPLTGRPLALAEFLSHAPGPDGLKTDTLLPLSFTSNDATSLLMGFDSSGPAAANTNTVPDRSRSPPAAQNDTEQTAAFCQMAADWCKLLAADRSVSTVEVGVGTAGLAATLLLAATSSTAAHLLCAGGVTNIIGGCVQRCGAAFRGGDRFELLRG